MIGLLHGFGFSFLPSDLLGRDSPHLVTSLLSFNLGIELGQLIIVSLVFAVMVGLARVGPSVRTFCERTIPLASILIAGWWLMERSRLLLLAT